MDVTQAISRKPFEGCGLKVLSGIDENCAEMGQTIMPTPSSAVFRRSLTCSRAPELLEDLDRPQNLQVRCLKPGLLILDISPQKDYATQTLHSFGRVRLGLFDMRVCIVWLGIAPLGELTQNGR